MVAGTTVVPRRDSVVPGDSVVPEDSVVSGDSVSESSERPPQRTFIIL